MLRPVLLAMFAAVGAAAQAALPQRPIYIDCLKTRVATTTVSGTQTKPSLGYERAQFKIDIDRGLITRAGEQPATWTIQTATDTDIEAVMTGIASIRTLSLNRISGELIEGHTTRESGSPIIRAYHVCHIAVPAF